MPSDVRTGMRTLHTKAECKQNGLFAYILLFHYWHILKKYFLAPVCALYSDEKVCNRK